MVEQLSTSSESETPRAGWPLATVEVALIVMVFFLHAAWPVPEVNEPHYLAKAKHYWNPDWVQGDFFLDSADAHQMFYWTFGWLTLWFPLPVVAWLGRIVTWALLAWAWRRASFALVPRALMSVLSAALFVSLLARGNLAGEWVVGGVEAKGFAYVLVLLGVEALIRGRFNRVWLLFGAAAAFHVLVGGWAVVAGGAAWLVAGKDRPGLVRMLPALVGGLLLSLPGLLPGLALTRGVEPDVVDEANQIYVFERLPHHLALHTLRSEELLKKLLRNAALLAAFLLLMRFARPERNARRLCGFVFGGVLIATVGLAICFATRNDPALAARVLRYYWFRLYDVVLPLGVALLGAGLIARLLSEKRPAGTLALAAAMSLACWHFGDTAYRRHHTEFALADRKMRVPEDWVDVCRWVEANTPRDARFLTPRMSQTFKWYTGRPEVVTQKDIPQDAAGIVEWSARLDALYPYRTDGERRYRQSIGRHNDTALRKLGEAYEAEFLICSTAVPHGFEQLYQNDSYVVYRLPAK